MSRLVVCASCARHVRASETACPFCEAALPDPGPAPATSAMRTTSRAALVFAAAAAVACGKTDAPKQDESVTVVTAYGPAPTMVDAGTPEIADASNAASKPDASKGKP